MTAARWLVLALLWALGACGAVHHHAPPRPPMAGGATPPNAQVGAFVVRGLALLEQGDHVRAEQYLMLAQRSGYDEHALIEPLLASCIAGNRLRAALGHADRYLARNDSARVRYVRAALQRALSPEAAP